MNLYTRFPFMHHIYDESLAESTQISTTRISSTIEIKNEENVLYKSIFIQFGILNTFLVCLLVILTLIILGTIISISLNFLKIKNSVLSVRSATKNLNEIQI